jgi:hypothetical protein
MPDANNKPLHVWEEVEVLCPSELAAHHLWDGQTGRIESIWPNGDVGVRFDDHHLGVGYVCGYELLLKPKRKYDEW